MLTSSQKKLNFELAASNFGTKELLTNSAANKPLQQKTPLCGDQNHQPILNAGSAKSFPDLLSAPPWGGGGGRWADDGLQASDAEERMATNNHGCNPALRDSFTSSPRFFCARRLLRWSWCRFTRQAPGNSLSRSPARYFRQSWI